MPPSSPLTASERKLCGGLLLLMALALTLPRLTFPDTGWTGVYRFCAAWLGSQWQLILSGQSPTPGRYEFVRGTLVATWVGMGFLIPQYLGYLLHRGRWLAPSILWFWTMICGSLLALSGSTMVVVHVWTATPWVDRKELIFGIAYTLFGLLIPILAFRAWRRRRREEKAARIMTEATA